MLGTAFCIATLVLGIEVGWEPDADGDLEYIIQIEPELARRMLDGRPIRYTVRPEHRGVRHVRIEVGTGEVPRRGELPPPPSATIEPRETSVKATLDPPGSGFPGVPPAPSPSPAPAAVEPGLPPTAESTPVAPADRATPWDEPDLPKPAESPDRMEVDSRPDTTADSMPGVLPFDVVAREISERPADHTEPTAPDAPTPATPSESPASNSLRTPLILASCMAVGFFAAFVFLLWVHVGTRTRYRRLLNDYYAAVGSPPGGGSLESAGLSPSM